MAGTLYIIAAASGTGKTSLAKELARTVANLKISISHTTRPMRAQEVANQSYFFTDHATFERMIAQHAFLEYAKVFDYYYGTSCAFVAEQLQQGIDVILDIDWQGAAQIKKIHPGSVTIFLLPPSKMELRRRLQQRKRDADAIIEQRLSLASQEVSHCSEFDYLVINDDFAVALQDLQTIVMANRLRGKLQLTRHAELIRDLLTT